MGWRGIFRRIAVHGGRSHVFRFNKQLVPTLIVLGISTILNAIYFMKTVIRIYTPVGEGEYPTMEWHDNKIYAIVLLCFVVLNILLGVCSQPIVDLIGSGLNIFA